MKYVFVLGYVVTLGGLDDDGGVRISQGRVVEGRKSAERLCEQAKIEGHPDAQVYMLIPPDAFPTSDS